MNTKDISEARDPLLPASLAALQRAAEQARRQALMTRTRLVVWRDGQIRYLDPSQADADDSNDTASGGSGLGDGAADIVTGELP